MKLLIPSFLQDDLDTDCVDVNVDSINGLKNQLSESEKIYGYIMNDNKDFRKNIRFVKNDELISEDEYDEKLGASDEVMLLLQFVGG